MAQRTIGRYEPQPRGTLPHSGNKCGRCGNPCGGKLCAPCTSTTYHDPYGVLDQEGSA